MSDNFNEGHPGAVISQITEYAKLSLPEDPNLVLLMAGTNDINNFLNVTTAADRLSGLVDEITSSVPNVTVIVAQITPAANSTVEQAMVTFNSQIRDLVASKVAAGQKVSTVNMMDYVTVDDLVDGLHPTDHGYQQMAKAWFAGIQDVQRKGWIDPPISTNITSAVTMTLQTALPTSTGISTSTSNSISTSTGTSTSTSSSSSGSSTPFKSASNPRYLIPSAGTISLSALTLWSTPDGTLTPYITQLRGGYKGWLNSYEVTTESTAGEGLMSVKQTHIHPSGISRACE
ncbi:hypothetical protein NHQ30_009952 [Ciborinia camelliae]|nr:hypothetical protein NHQ30_009952 [Ciborinia camelliae]